MYQGLVLGHMGVQACARQGESSAGGYTVSGRKDGKDAHRQIATRTVAVALDVPMRTRATHSRGNFVSNRQ